MMTDYEQKHFDSIPKKWRERVAEVEYAPGDEGYGAWWIYLAAGWCCNASSAPHTIHETWAWALKCLRASEPCDCEECQDILDIHHAVLGNETEN